MADIGGTARVGLGFDVHPKEQGRVLMLGGLRWDGEDGLAGHSDGDVVCHAVADAVLGAGALGDVGEHFPESDPRSPGSQDSICSPARSRPCGRQGSHRHRAISR